MDRPVRCEHEHEHGCVYVTRRENQTPKSIARHLKVPVTLLISLNSQLERLTRKSRFHTGTKLFLVPQDSVCQACQAGQPGSPSAAAEGTPSSGMPMQVGTPMRRKFAGAGIFDGRYGHVLRQMCPHVHAHVLTHVYAAS